MAKAKKPRVERPKAANGEGTCYPIRRGGKTGPIIGYRAQITLPNGRRKSISGKVKEDIENRMILVKADLVKGLPVPIGRQTLGEYLATWIDTKSKLRPSSRRRYRNAIDHITKALGKIPLVNLATHPDQVLRFYTQLQEEGPDGEKGLSGTTVHGIHFVLHRALKDAMRMGLIAINVTEEFDAPGRDDFEMQPLDEEQANQFLAACVGDRFEALYVLALSTGMRRGELLGLRWRDIALERRTLSVRTNVTEARQQKGVKAAQVIVTAGTKRYILANTKTKHSRRTISLSQTAVEALKAHKLRQEEERQKLGQHWQNYDLVFPNQTGGLMIPDNLAKRGFKKLLEKAGLPDIRFHDLRHTAATLAIARGANIKQVSEMLGHSDVKTTLSIYTHVIPNMHQAVAEVMDDILGKGKETD
jgi:integrase